MTHRKWLFFCCVFFIWRPNPSPLDLDICLWRPGKPRPLTDWRARGTASPGRAAAWRGRRARLRGPKGPEREEWSLHRRPTICRSRLPERKHVNLCLKHPFMFNKNTTKSVETYLQRFHEQLCGYNGQIFHIHS